MFPSLWTVLAAVPAETQTSYVQRMNLVYAEKHGTGLLMDVFKPKSARNGLAIVDIVSSGFVSDRWCFQQHVDWKLYDALCARGFTVFAIRPGSHPKWSISEMQEHVRMGIRFVKAHADDYAVVAEPLGLVGVSAGGYLTCLTALTPIAGDPTAENALDRRRTHVAAAAPVCPLTDIRSWWEVAGDEEARNTAKRLGLTQEEDQTRENIAKRAEELSPLCLVKADAPAFLFTHAKGDPIVPFEHSDTMVKALEQIGAAAQLRTIDSNEHIWANISEDMEAIADWFEGKLRLVRNKHWGNTE